MEPDRSCISRHDPGQIHDLLLRTFAGIRRRMEISRLDPDSPLGDHIACHRAVDPAGQQKHRLPVGSHRHPACSGNDLGIDIYLVPDLNIQHHVWMMHIHPGLRKRVKDRLSQVTVDLH